VRGTKMGRGERWGKGEFLGEGRSSALAARLTRSITVVDSRVGTGAETLLSVVPLRCPKALPMHPFILHVFYSFLILCFP